MEVQEKTTRTIHLTDAEADIEVTVHIAMRTIDTDYRMASIGQHPAIPDDLLEPLWERGLSNGISNSIGESGYDFALGDLEVDFKELRFTTELENLTESDVLALTLGLRELAEEVSAQAIDVIISSSSGQFAG